MFSVYSIAGPVFSGTMEEMIQVRALARARSVRGIAQEGNERGGAANANAVRQTHDEAVRAYLAMLPSEIERGPLYHAVQIMQSRVITVSDNNTVAQTWRILHGNNIHQAPVLNDNAQLVGIVSEHNLLTAITVEADRIVENIKRRVNEIMTTPVVAAAPMTDIRRIAFVMLDYGVEGIPVTNDSGGLIGFISRSDILRAVVKNPPLSLWR